MDFCGHDSNNKSVLAQLLAGRGALQRLLLQLSFRPEIRAEQYELVPER